MSPAESEASILQPRCAGLISLPHQPPMRLIEQVRDVIPGQRATGSRTTEPGDFYFQGHFPGQPIVPAVILIEMLAQTGGIAAASPPDGTSARRCSCAWQRSGRSSFQPRPAGALLEAHARVAGRLGGMIKIEGGITADGRIVGTGSLTLAG